MNKIIISVIVPVYNEGEKIRAFLDSVLNQSMKRELYEVILIDNGSTDETLQFCRKYINEVIILEENSYLNSPYSARNRGIEKAKGEIIALVDSNCTPTFNWLENGIQFLKHSEADLVGGAVVFKINSSSSAAEIIDAHTSIRMQWSIEKRKNAYTANLFVKKDVFDKIGLFPEGVRSGGDVRFTSKATSSGYSLAYSNNTLVNKRARKFEKLIKKKWRVSVQQIQNWTERNEDTSTKRLTHRFIHKIILPPKPGRIKLDYQTYPDLKKIGIYKRIRLWVIDYAIMFTEGIGLFFGFFKFKKNIK